MNFQAIPPVESSKELLDLAFRKAREKGQQKNLKGNWLQIIRQKEALKLDVIKDSIVPKLDKAMRSMPETAILPPFYVKLMKLTLDFPAYKQSCGALYWAQGKVRDLHKKYVALVVKTKERPKITSLMREFYGRLSSILKQIDQNVKYLNEVRKVLKTYPDIKEMFTVCIYGFPNVGKTTLLNKLTGTTAKTASYAFTTLGINAGYFTLGKKKIQVLDVPGTLARKDKMNAVELQAELVATDVADVFVYVFDLTANCGYSVAKQEALYQKIIQGDKKVFVYLSKLDLLDKKVVSDFKHQHYTLEEIKENIIKLVPEIPADSPTDRPADSPIDYLTDSFSDSSD